MSAEETKAAPEPKVPRTYDFHPIANLFPILDKDSIGFKALVEDIKANRQYEPVYLLDGKILDGRNRYNACQLLGKDIQTRDYPGSDPIGFVLSVNLHRRHLNTSQRAMVAAKLATFTHGGDRSKPSIGGLTDAEAAKLLNVSERSVERARQVLAKGDPSLIEELEQGQTTVTDAAAAADKEPEKPDKGKDPDRPNPEKVDKITNRLIAALKELKDYDADTAIAAASNVVQRLQDAGFLERTKKVA
jgi:ParB-like chromosome segregation protein Spo0J